MIDGHRTTLSGYSGAGLERSCEPAGDTWRSHAAAEGFELLAARFFGRPYDRHRHDTYNIGVTVSGVQMFRYRGAQEVSTAGEVFILHPDELHDGHSGTEAGFAYLQLSVAPIRIADAVQTITGRPGPLPFVRDSVSTSRDLAAAIKAAFESGPESLEPVAIDTVILRLAEGLVRGDSSFQADQPVPRIDRVAVERARQFLNAERCRVVRSAELESVTGLSRFDLARQFRAALGTSPYRYLTMRRLDGARDLIRRGAALSAVAAETGFADQAHLTRRFRAAYGMTPARYAALERYSLK